VTQEDLLTVAAVAAKYSSQLAADNVTDATSEHVSNSQTTETFAASLPADLSKLKFGGKILTTVMELDFTVVFVVCELKNG